MATEICIISVNRRGDILNFEVWFYWNSEDNPANIYSDIQATVISSIPIRKIKKVVEDKPVIVEDIRFQDMYAGFSADSMECGRVFNMLRTHFFLNHRAKNKVIS